MITASTWLDKITTIDSWPQALVVVALIAAVAWIAVTIIKEMM